MKLDYNKKERAGFTLVETIIVIFIFTILALGVSSLFTHIFTSSRDRLSAIDDIDQSRQVTSSFINEIRVASVGNDGSFPITLADDDQVMFFSSYGQATNTQARIRYYRATSTLYKATVIPTGLPLTYDLGTEKIVAVQKNLSSTTSPLFYYYDGDYMSTSTALTQPVNLTDIRFIRISLNVDDHYTVSAGASIRNLKDNLGN
jgi:prepilin-type N-terminal cleavage/methylation domain-containing protein